MTLLDKLKFVLARDEPEEEEPESEAETCPGCGSEGPIDITGIDGVQRRLCSRCGKNFDAATPKAET
jgi:transposase-like protein